MVRSLGLYLAEIFESAFLIEEYTRSCDHKSFEKKRMVRDAVVHNLIIIGEATKNIPDDVRAEFIGIEWKKIVGLRNIAVHMYHELNYEHIWKIVNEALPGYIRKLEEVSKHVLDLDQQGFDEFIEKVKYHMNNPS